MQITAVVCTESQFFVFESLSLFFFKPRAKSEALLVEPDDSIEVEVVGWLVQHQQGGLHEQSSVKRSCHNVINNRFIPSKLKTDIDRIDTISCFGY